MKRWDRWLETMKNRILVVDDDVDFAEELHELLSLSGYSPITVNDSAEAVSVARKTRPDLIIIDIKMQGLNGFQIADKLNQFSETWDIPVIAMTGYYINGEHMPLMTMLGMRTLLKKPFQPLTLIAGIEAALNEKNR